MLILQTLALIRYQIWTFVDFKQTKVQIGKLQQVDI